MPANRVLHLIGFEHLPPLHVDTHNFGSAAARDLAQQVTEAAEDGYQNPVPGREH